MNIREALAKGSAELKAGGIESSSLDASLLLAHVLNITRTSLLAKGTDLIAEDALAAFNALVQRRLNGECAAYILGKKEFRGLEFLVNKFVLVPRPETETLVETAIEMLGKKKDTAEPIRVLDLCTGSGAIAVSIKNEMPHAQVFAADISEQALEIAKTNAARLLPDSAITFFLGDLFFALSDNALPFFALSDNALPFFALSDNALPFFALSNDAQHNEALHNEAQHNEAPHKKQFSLIASNPPYIPTDEIKTLAAEVQNEPHIALDGGHTGLEILERIIEGAPEYLIKGGILLMETAGEKQTEKISALLEKKGFHDIKSYCDLSGCKRVISGVYEE